MNESANARATAEEEFLTAEELREWLRLGKTKTEELLRSSTIPSYRIGRRRIIKRADVLAWLEENRFRPGE